MSNNRNLRKLIAEETLKVIENGQYHSGENKVDVSSAIKSMVESTVLYKPDDFDKKQSRVGFNTKITLSTESTFSAAHRLVTEGKRVCCLNFASAKNPGGGFLGGAQAQEECLARASALYESLISKFEYYEVNRAFTSCMYTDYMIYSPDVPVFRDDEDKFLREPFLCSVVTAPAVNMGVIQSREKQNVCKALSTMKQRIYKLLTLCANEGEENLILGAWGCGVFQNDPEWMAETFKEALRSKEFDGVFETILFAIPNNSKRGMKNHTAFSKIFG